MIFREMTPETTHAESTFVPSLASILTSLVDLAPGTGQITRFHAVKAPDISIANYLERIQKYFQCSNECFVLSLIYIDRIVKDHEDFTVSIFNIHRLLVTSVMLAAKFFDDVYYSNSFYAKVGGVKTKEINLLEAHFLSLINYKLFVTPKEYNQYLQNVTTAIHNAQIASKGFVNNPIPKYRVTAIREDTQLPSYVSSVDQNIHTHKKKIFK